MSPRARTTIHAEVRQFDIGNVEDAALVGDGRLTRQRTVVLLPRVIQPHLLITTGTQVVTLIGMVKIKSKVYYRRCNFKITITEQYIVFMSHIAIIHNQCSAQVFKRAGCHLKRAL